MKAEILFDFVTEIEEKNTWLINQIKENDENTYKILIKVKADIFMLQSLGENELAHQLTQKYKSVIVSAYAYFLKIEREK